MFVQLAFEVDVDMFLLILFSLFVVSVYHRVGWSSELTTPGHSGGI